jgi:hypothetical protein
MTSMILALSLVLNTTSRILNWKRTGYVCPWVKSLGSILLDGVTGVADYQCGKFPEKELFPPFTIIPARRKH